ncbi:hypothetical protein [Actinomyces gaoshouyii]|uniref:hypothetical protein n=1 Tax=Actinomyces gaoshouyii TaxID=1960083 RepID=UPI000F793AC0|nr:hypothetical protein [Actinomyces gaoshouyii]
MSQPMTPGPPYHRQSAPSAPGAPGGYQAQYQHPQPAQYAPGQQMPGQPAPARPAGDSMLSALFNGSVGFAGKHAHQIFLVAALCYGGGWLLDVITGLAITAGIEYGASAAWMRFLFSTLLGDGARVLAQLLLFRLILEIARHLSLRGPQD